MSDKKKPSNYVTFKFAKKHAGFKKDETTTMHRSTAEALEVHKIGSVGSDVVAEKPQKKQK